MLELNHESKCAALVNHYRFLNIPNVIPANGPSPVCVIQSSDGSKTCDVPDNADSVTLSSFPEPGAYLPVQAPASAFPTLVWHAPGLPRFQAAYWFF